MCNSTERERFDWDNGNRDHLEDFDLDEVEQAFRDPNRLGANAYNSGSEKRFGLLGATEEGAILYVIYTYRGDRIRVVTARTTTHREKRRYRWRGK